MKTRLTQLLGIEHPIFQGGMAWVADGALAGAVSKGGGLGIIGAGEAPIAWVREQIRLVRSITDKPFGVNVMLMSPTSPEVMALLIEERVPVAVTGAGNPIPYIPALKEAGVLVIPVIPTCALALRVERGGADAVIAEGSEAGGHIGELNTLALIPQVADAVSIPVVAAGGIADGRGLAAVTMLGASGAQLGTRFICASECSAHINFKNKVVEAKDSDTAVCGRPTGHPVRVIKNKLARQYRYAEDEGVSKEELEKLGTGKLRLAVVDGDVDYGSVMAGQSGGLVKRIQPAAEIISEIVTEAEALLSGGWKNG